MVDTDDRVHEALVGLHTISEEVSINSQPTGEASIEYVSKFLTDDCGCKKARGKSCTSQFSTEYIVSVRESCLELSHSELDMAIMGQLMAGMNTSSTVSTASRHKEVNRDKNYTTLFHLGKPVCLKTFQFLHAVGKKRLRNLMANVRSNGLTPRVHGNMRRRPRHALSFNSTEHVVRFLHIYAEEHAMLLPGRIPGYPRTDIQLLPSSLSKRAIWRVYYEAAQQATTSIQ